MDAPVIFLIFNRPDLTAQVFEAIRAARPRHLRVVADAPRSDRAGEAALCRAARAVVEGVDWPCEVTRDYADENLGCGRRVSSGLTAAFADYESAVVLEDDCLPSPSFFRFCDEMLDRYRDDERVMHVGGSNVMIGRSQGPHSYLFARHTPIWGWATWRRAWAMYDFDVTLWPQFDAGGRLADVCATADEERYWRQRFRSVHTHENDTWDYQWTFTCWSQGGLSAVPERNLVTNLGFRADATHTTAPSAVAGLGAGELEWPLRHPPFVLDDRSADRHMAEYVFGLKAGRGRISRLQYRLWRLWSIIRPATRSGPAGVVQVRRSAVVPPAPVE